jgi:hypothetical protein
MRIVDFQERRAVMFAGSQAYDNGLELHAQFLECPPRSNRTRRGKLE